MSEETNDKPIRLPLWRSAVETLLANGLTYGQSIPTEWFEDHLKEKRADTLKFGKAITKVRKELEKHGFHLSGRGHNTHGFSILAAPQNSDVGTNRMRLAKDQYHRAINLLASTDVSFLKPDEARRHEAVLQRAQIRLALVSRGNQIYKHVVDTAPKLIEPSKEPEE